MRKLFAGLIFLSALSFSLAEETDEICPPGKYYVIKTDDCLSCPIGTFANGTVPLTQCEPCPPGTYGESKGASRCYPCLSNTYEVNRLSCERCPPGTSSKMESSGPDSCIPCQPGFIGLSSEAGCVACSPGRYEVDRKSCKPCPAGTSSKSGSKSQDECFECEVGLVALSPGSKECATCGKGYYELYRQFCKGCPAGTFSEDEKASSSDTCKACPVGSIAAEGSGWCRKCSRGEYEVNRTSCEECPDGAVSKEGSNACTVCPVGTVPDSFYEKCVKKDGDNQKEEKDVEESENKILYVIGGAGILAMLVFVVMYRNAKKRDYESENDQGVNINLMYQNEQKQ